MTTNTEPLKVGELKPCPFCGGSAEEWQKYSSYTYDQGPSGRSENCGSWVQVFGCKSCRTEKYSREAWNRRTEPSPAEVGSEGLPPMSTQTPLGYIQAYGVELLMYGQMSKQTVIFAERDELAQPPMVPLYIGEQLRDYARIALNQRLAVKEGETEPIGYVLECADMTYSVIREKGFYPAKHERAVYFAHPVSDDQQAKDAALAELLRSWLNVAQHCEITDGVCCCGDSMDRHPSESYCGHTPFDHGAYVVECLVRKTQDAIDAALSTTKQEG